MREGKKLKGRALGVVIGTVGKGRFEKALHTTVKAIEARNYGASSADVAGSATSDGAGRSDASVSQMDDA